MPYLQLKKRSETKQKKRYRHNDLQNRRHVTVFEGEESQRKKQGNEPEAG
jgi:hypothetical protein